MRTIRRTAAVLVIASLGLAAFATPTSARARAAAAAPTGDIVATAQAAGQFTTLLAAAEAAGLVDALKAPGPFTVFAPTDAAFAALLAELNVSAGQLLANKDLLTQVLTYHVLAGAVPSSAITGVLTPATLNGKKLLITPLPQGIAINFRAKVVAADVQATNGVIHVIDKVLLPPEDKPANDIVSVAKAAGQFTTLLAAAERAGLVETLMGPGPYTVFAPTDRAFNTLLRRLRTTPEKLLSDPARLRRVLTYHVVPGKVTSDQLKRRNVAKTVNGRPIVIRKTSKTVTVNRTARVVQADIMASNGVIHVINRVLIPRNF
jgi:uncharacterized surface protein with fasciclin (FAS1) repeats